MSRLGELERGASDDPYRKKPSWHRRRVYRAIVVVALTSSAVFCHTQLLRLGVWGEAVHQISRLVRSDSSTPTSMPASAGATDFCAIDGSAAAEASYAPDFKYQSPDELLRALCNIHGKVFFAADGYTHLLEKDLRDAILDAVKSAIPENANRYELDPFAMYHSEESSVIKRTDFALHAEDSASGNITICTLIDDGRTICDDYWVSFIRQDGEWRLQNVDFLLKKDENGVSLLSLMAGLSAAQNKKWTQVAKDLSHPIETTIAVTTDKSPAVTAEMEGLSIISSLPLGVQRYHEATIKEACFKSESPTRYEQDFAIHHPIPQQTASIYLLDYSKMSCGGVRPFCASGGCLLQLFRADMNGRVTQVFDDNVVNHLIDYVPYYRLQLKYALQGDACRENYVAGACAHTLDLIRVDGLNNERPHLTQAAASPQPGQRLSAIKGSGSTLQRRLVERWQTLNEDCRGGPGGSDATFEACDQRKIIFKQLSARRCHFHLGDYWTCN